VVSCCTRVTGGFDFGGQLTAGIHGLGSATGRELRPCRAVYLSKQLAKARCAAGPSSSEAPGTPPAEDSGLAREPERITILELVNAVRRWQADPYVCRRRLSQARGRGSGARSEGTANAALCALRRGLSGRRAARKRGRGTRLGRGGFTVAEIVAREGLPGRVVPEEETAELLSNPAGLSGVRRQEVRRSGSGLRKQPGEAGSPIRRRATKALQQVGLHGGPGRVGMRHPTRMRPSSGEVTCTLRPISRGSARL